MNEGGDRLSLVVDDDLDEQNTFCGLEVGGSTQSGQESLVRWPTRWSRR